MASSPPAGTGFHAALPVLPDFSHATRPDNYTPLPEDWHVALCDVRNSTGAVKAGNYKKVNSLGAAAITAVLNAAGDIDIPFAFEGDGCVLCVPPRLLEDARAALAKTREIASESFSLDLRIGTIPVAHIRRAGHAIMVARFRVSEHCVQAVFAGGGMALADRLIKDPATASAYLVAPGSVEPHGSLDGFECRWRDRQILAGTEWQRRALDAWLQERYERGELVYGLHATDRAQMTCLVFDYAGRHLHFVDGAGGGLFLAAQDFKERVAQRAARNANR